MMQSFPQVIRRAGLSQAQASLVLNHLDELEAHYQTEMASLLDVLVDHVPDRAEAILEHGWGYLFMDEESTAA